MKLYIRVLRTDPCLANNPLLMEIIEFFFFLKKKKNWLYMVVVFLEFNIALSCIPSLVWLLWKLTVSADSICYVE
jgi:hypothetical protein